MPIGTILRIVVSFAQGVNGVCQNIYHLVTMQAGITNGTLTTDLQAWFFNLYGSLNPIIRSDVTLQYVRVYRWNNGTGFDFQFDTTFSWNPIAVAQRIPSLSAPLVTARTSGGGVSKKFFPAVTEEGQDDGILTSYALTQLAASAARVVSGPNIIRYQPVVVNPNGEVSITSKPLGSVAIATSLLAVQRRRKRGVGV